MTGPDPEVAAGAGMFGAMALGTIWVFWPLGTLVLGLLVLVTRGRKRLIPRPGGRAGLTGLRFRQGSSRRRLTEAWGEATFAPIRGPSAASTGGDAGCRKSH